MKHKLLSIFLIIICIGSFGLAEEKVIVLQNGLSGYKGEIEVCLSSGGTSIGLIQLGRALLRFDLDSLPKDKFVLEARMELYCHKATEEREVSVGVGKVLNPWKVGEASWENASSREKWVYPGLLPGADWQTKSMKIISPAKITPDLFAVAVKVKDTGKWYQWDITEIVRDWLIWPETNHGLYVAALGCRTDWPALFKFFSGGGAGDIAPRLIIRFNEKGPGACAGPDVLRPGILQLALRPGERGLPDVEKETERFIENGLKEKTTDSILDELEEDLPFLKEGAKDSTNDAKKDDAKKIEQEPGIKDRRITLDASRSRGEDLKYQWSLIEKPWYSKLTGKDIEGGDRKIAFFLPDANGVYRFSLEVTDSEGQKDRDFVNVEVFHIEPHPRLFLDKATETRLKEFINNNPEDQLWKQSKRGMLAWQLAGDREAGRGAVAGAVATARKWNKSPPTPGNSFEHTGTAESMAYVFDSCSELMTPEEKEEIIRCGNNAAWGALHGFCGSFNGGDTLYNHFTTRLLGSFLWGVASYGDDPQAQIFFDNGHQILSHVMAKEYKPWVIGGGMWEGGDYGWADFRHTLQMMLAIKTATGEDLTRIINLADRIPFFIHATRPTGDCFYFMGHAWSNNWITGTFYGRYRWMVIQFANAYPEVGIYVPTFLNRTTLVEEGGSDLGELLLRANFPEAKDYEVDWPPCWHASALGVVLARSSWADPKATHLSFICGPYIHNYADQDQGHFEIFKRGILVTDIRDRDCYMDYTLPSHMHNTVVVNEFGKETSGGQRGVNRTIGAGGKITALEDDYVNYLYVCGDLTGAYLEDRIEKYTRQVVFVRPDYVIVFDRVITPTPDWRKRFFLYLFNEPREEGGYWVMQHWPAKLLIKTLLPRDPVTNVVGPGYDGKGAPKGPRRTGASYHLEIEGKEKGKECLFLHFFKATDAEVKEIPKCELVEKEGNVGLRFAEGENDCTVLFCSQGSAGGHITIQKESKRVVDRVLTQKVVTPPLLLPPGERERQRKIIAELQASRPPAGPEEKISEKAGEEFEFSGITWVNYGGAKITRTSDGTLHILGHGMRTKNPLDFPVQVEVRGKLRRYSDHFSFGLCDKDGGHARRIFEAGGEIGIEVDWITTGTYVNERVRLGRFYRSLCTLNPGGIIPFEGVMMTEDGVTMGKAKEPGGVSFFDPEARYLYIGCESPGRMNQIGSVKIKQMKSMACEGELLRWGRLLIGDDPTAGESSTRGLSYLARSNGWMYARSDWTDDMTWVALHGGGGRRADDQGAFVIYKKGWLAVPVKVFSTWEAVSENDLSLKVGDGSHYIGSWHRGPIRGIQRFEDKDRYVYTMVDLLPAKAEKLPEYGGILDAYDFLDSCERHLVYVRPDHVVLFDRVRPKDAKYYPIWTVHFMQEPKFSGKVVTACVDTAGISLTTLLPEKVFRAKQIVGKSKKAWELTESESGSEAPDAPKLPDVPSKEMLEEPSIDKFLLEMLTDKFFLHLFQTSAGEPKVPSAHLLKGKDTFGVKFALGAGHCEVVFKKDSSGGHIKIVGENEKVIMDRDLTTQVVLPKQ